MPKVDTERREDIKKTATEDRSVLPQNVSRYEARGYTSLGPSKAYPKTNLVGMKSPDPEDPEGTSGDTSGDGDDGDTTKPNKKKGLLGALRRKK